MTDSVSLCGALTPRQQFWLEHLRACAEQGLSLKAYAQANDLAPGALYAAKSALKRRGALASAPMPSAPTFVPVRIARAEVVFRVSLPNGVVVEVPEHADAGACRELLVGASTLA
jgi:hypothetical protein